MTPNSCASFGKQYTCNFNGKYFCTDVCGSDYCGGGDCHAESEGNNGYDGKRKCRSVSGLRHSIKCSFRPSCWPNNIAVPCCISFKRKIKLKLQLDTCKVQGEYPAICIIIFIILTSLGYSLFLVGKENTEYSIFY